MGTKLNNAPLYYTIVQIQFNPILDLDAYVPRIQSEMRKARFPDYKKGSFQRLVFNPDPSQISSPSVINNPCYLFGDMEKSSFFLLETNALSFQTTRYDTFQIFLDTMLKGLVILHDVIRIDFIERIGLRYLNAIQPSKDVETLNDFLVQEVLGHSTRWKNELQHSISETSASTSSGQLISRVLIRDEYIQLPGELCSFFTPTIDERFTQKKSLHAIVDTDAFIIRREIFELEKVSTYLVSLHDEIIKSFYATVTDYARESWA